MYRTYFWDSENESASRRHFLIGCGLMCLEKNVIAYSNDEDDDTDIFSNLIHKSAAQKL